MRSAAGWAVVAGLGMGLAYAASPLVVLALLALATIIWYAGYGLERRERELVTLVLVAASALRLFAIAALFLTSRHDQIVSFPWDGDGVFLKRRGFLIASTWAGLPLEPASAFAAFDHSYGWSSYQYVLGYLQHLFGSAPYAPHALNVVLFISVAVALYRLCRSSFGRLPAFIGLTVLVFLPTLLAWSVSALKESLYMFLVAAGVIAAIMCVRAKGAWRKALALAVLVAAVSANHTVRNGALVIMTAGIGAGLAASFVLRRPLVLIAVLLGAVVAAPVAWSMPSVRDRVLGQIRLAAERHMGSVRTDGHGYKLLDQRFYSENVPGEYNPVPTMTSAETARFLLRGLASIVLVPLPWTAASTLEIALLAQQALWYVIVAFAVVGIWAGARRDALVTMTLAGTAAIGGTVIALSNGNIGTLVRFRDTLVPFTVWLGAMGVVAVARWLTPRAAAPGRPAEMIA